MKKSFITAIFFKKHNKEIKFLFAKKFEKPKNPTELFEVIKTCNKEVTESWKLLRDLKNTAQSLQDNGIKPIGFDNYDKVIFFLRGLPKQLVQKY